MNYLIRSKRRGLQSLIFVGLLWVAALPKANAVTPPPDGGYPGGNTAEGQSALLGLTIGTYNTAAGFFSLLSNTEGSFNTAVGAGALLFNIGDENTGEGMENTAVGAVALLSNTSGRQNTAIGESALLSNTVGLDNTATGQRALYHNTIGSQNNAFGILALFSNDTGGDNNAFGSFALYFNTSGSFNVADGFRALYHNTGSNNTAIGYSAGESLSTGDGNVCVGSGVSGEPGVSNKTYIRNINTTTVSGGNTDSVTVNLSTGLLGHAISSRRYKEKIKPMDRASEALYALKPVIFHYKKEIDPAQTLDFGLIAEQVAEVNPELAVRDGEGKISNYRRDAVNAMLLNEFLKEHKAFLEEQLKGQEQDRKIQEQQATIAQLKKALETILAHEKDQDSKIQRVSDQVEISKAAEELVANEP